MFYFIINVYTFVFVICLIYNYWSLFYGFVCDPLAVLLVLSVQALIKNKKNINDCEFLTIVYFES